MRAVSVPVTSNRINFKAVESTKEIRNCDGSQKKRLGDLENGSLVYIFSKVYPVLCKSPAYAHTLCVSHNLLYKMGLCHKIARDLEDTIQCQSPPPQGMPRTRSGCS